MRVTRLPVLALLLALAGCGGGSGAVPGNDDPTFSGGGPTSAPSSADRSTPSVTPSASTATTAAFDPTRDAAADVATALHEAASDAEPVLLDFGASWCPDCVWLSRTFATAAVRPVLAGFHVVEIDVGKFDRNQDLAARFGLDYRHSGIPALVVLSPSGAVRTTTEDGSYADARNLTPDQVATFLRRWQH